MREEMDEIATLPDPNSRPIVRILIPVWGAKYIELFCQVGLPALLATGNLPFLLRATDCAVTFLTTRSSIQHYEANPAFRKLQQTCPTSFIHIDDITNLNSYGVTLTLAYARGIKAMGERQR